MGNAKQNPASQTSYLDFFGLERPPFARLDGPASIYAAEQYPMLFDKLTAAKSEPDCLLVLRGVDGAGKTTLLNRYLSCLCDDETFASIDESCKSAIAFYQAFFEQIGFENIDGKLEELQTITREFLVHRAVLGDPVLLVIDNAHNIHPAVFQQLLWLATIEHKGSRVFSAVLAGNSKLDRILESPAMVRLGFRRRMNFHIRVFTEEETAEYISFRLVLADMASNVTFTPEALALVHRFTGGIPRMINRVCSLLLGEACKRESTRIDDGIVRAVAEAHQLPANVFPLKRRGRRKTDVDLGMSAADTGEMEQIKLGEAPNDDTRRRRVAAPPEPDVDIVHLFDQVAELSAQIGQLKAEKAKTAESHEKQLDAQKRALRTARSKATRAENRAAKLEEAKASLLQASLKLRADLRSAKKKTKELSKAEQQLEKTEKERESLLADLAELENLRDTIVDKDRNIAALKEELAELTLSDTQTRARLVALPEPVVDDDEDGESRNGDSRITAFEVVRRGKVEKVFEVPDGDARIMIGRSDDSELQLDSEFVSRHHALVFRKGGKIYIEDLNSFNGTILNGKNVSRSQLRADDAVIIGEYRIQPLAKSD